MRTLAFVAQGEIYGSFGNAGPRAKGPVFFNVDQPVGQGPGVPEPLSLSTDVQLVQVFLKVLGFYKPTTCSAALIMTGNTSAVATLPHQLSHIRRLSLHRQEQKAIGGAAGEL
jgi:hypothetical protein